MCNTKGLLQLWQLKEHMATIVVDQYLKNSSIYKHIF